MAADGTDVVPDSVSTFGMKSLDAGNELMGQTGSALGEIGGGVKAGASNIAEGANFRAKYAAEVDRLGMFHEDAMTGLMALHFGAITIAQNYRNADMSQSEQMNSVDAAFNPAAGTPSMRSQAAENKIRAAAEAAKNPPVGKELPPAQEQPPVMGPVAATPRQVVDAHDARYGKKETWAPPPPKAPSGPPPATAVTGTTTTTAPPQSPHATVAPKPTAGGAAAPPTTAPAPAAAKPAVVVRMEKTETVTPAATPAPTAGA